MPTNPSKASIHAVRWLERWQAWGKPRLAMDLRFAPMKDGDYEGHLGCSGIVLRFAGEPFEYGDMALQAFKVFAGDEDISVLVADLAGLSSDDGCLIILFREQWWEAMTKVAGMVLLAHCKAAMACGDVEAMWALDKTVAGEQVAILEAMLLADAVEPAAISTRSNRSRL